MYKQKFLLSSMNATMFMLQGVYAYTYVYVYT